METSREQQKILAQENIKICALADAAYPALLRQIAQAPEILYYQGALPVPDEFTLAVVGTRKHTSYAARVIDLIVPSLVRTGATIISGLALGIDTLAHQAAIRVGGKTVAVLGGGIDRRTLYPPTNLALTESIIKNGGAVISEYPPLFRPSKITFPARNRIIAGLARGVLVVEAPEKSGALITAYAALEQNRDVFAVPGDITRPESAGANALIRRGAKPVLGPLDILEEYGIELEKTPRAMPKLDKDEAFVVSLLNHEPKHIDEFSVQCPLPVSALAGLLSILELKGVIKNIGGMRYVRM